MSDRPMDDDAALRERWRVYLREGVPDAVRELVATYPEQRSLAVDMVALHEHDPELVSALFDAPDQVLRAGDAALRGCHGSLTDARLRVTDDPQVVSLARLGAGHLGDLVTVEGEVTGVGEVEPVPVRAVYECPRCGHREERRPRGVGHSSPECCGACGRARSLTLARERSTFVDGQRLTVVPVPDERDAAAPRSVTALLQGDLVGRATPETELFLTGVARALPDGDRFRLALDTLDTAEERTPRESAGLDARLDAEWVSAGH